MISFLQFLQRLKNSFCFIPLLVLVFLISNSSMCYILFTIRNYYDLEVAYAISSWMSLEAGKQLLCFAVCFVMGMLSKASQYQWKALLNSHREWMKPLLCASMKQVMGDTEVELSQSRQADPYPHWVYGDAAPKSGLPSAYWGGLRICFQEYTFSHISKWIMKSWCHHAVCQSLLNQICQRKCSRILNFYKFNKNRQLHQGKRPN